MKKCFFILPTTAYPPNGPIVLGSLLSNPHNPEESLNGNAIVPFPTRMAIISSEERQVSKQATTERAVSGGIFAKWLEGMGVDLSIARKKHTSDTYHFERLERRLIVPDLEYVEQALRDPKIEKLIKDSKFQINLYMVTGVQLGTGARRTANKSSGTGVNTSLGVDLTAAGVPGASVGPKFSASGASNETTSFQGATDFVYAYRVKEIIYRRSKIILRDVDKGQTYEQGEECSAERLWQRHEDREKMMTSGDFEVLGVSKDEISLEDLDLEGQTVEDDEEGECEVCRVEIRE